VKPKIKRTINQLAPVALAIVSLVILIATGGIVLAEMEGTSYTDVSVTDEVDQPSEPLPSNYTLDGSNTADYVQIKENTVEVVLEDASAGTNTTLDIDSDYIVYTESGEVELQSSPGGVTYNGTEDQVYTTYEYEKEGTATATLGQGQSALQTFSDFFTVIVVVAVAAVIFLLLGALRKAGGKTMA